MVSQDKSQTPYTYTTTEVTDEKKPLLARPLQTSQLTTKTSIPARSGNSTYSSLVEALKLLLDTLLAPGRFILACFYDDDEHFSTLMPFHYLGRALGWRDTEQKRPLIHNSLPGMRDNAPEQSKISDTEKSSMEAESDPSEGNVGASQTTYFTRSQSTPSQDNEAPNLRRLVRIRTGDESLRLRRSQREQRQVLESIAGANASEPPLTVDSIKSPTSLATASRVTKYPHAPAPPRPLVPKRQPSYSSIIPNPVLSSRKTLIIDLDETLIHSMAKGGRYSTGHMVEVKLQTPVGMGGTMLGPQVPILYYVHKRPHCDEFLRKVSRWYNLIVFTASVQEYADPVVDLLELERKYFSARYYRQHCTYRNGAYIKDLSFVEPDLSKVMILDNSPLSYIFHEGTLNEVANQLMP